MTASLCFYESRITSTIILISLAVSIFWHSLLSEFGFCGWHGLIVRVIFWLFDSICWCTSSRSISASRWLRRFWLAVLTRARVFWLKLRFGRDHRLAGSDPMNSVHLLIPLFQQGVETGLRLSWIHSNEFHWDFLLKNSFQLTTFH